MKPFYVYLLRCGDGTYYTGHTDNIEGWMQQHADGDSGYVGSRGRFDLVWQGEFETRAGALEFERRLKGWSRAKKEALMAGHWERVQELAKSRGSERSGFSSVRPEPVEGPLSVESPEKRLRQAQPERSGAQPERAAADLATPILHGTPAAQRRALAKAITLIESTRPDHRVQADELLTALSQRAGHSFRLGISGVPGVGKSTFIEMLGLHLIAQGHRVAVLAVDPSSSVSGGSILGDKTRMEQLSVHPQAFIRPSPSSGTLGGVAEKTREAVLLCEAALYDIVIVETVGVGQSETAVANMTDMFVLMQLPNAGDDLQAIKKGVMELADLVVINKADLDPDAATRAQAQITSALRLFTQHGRGARTAGGDAQPSPWRPQVMQISALRQLGIDAFWQTVGQFRQTAAASGALQARRRHQALAWMWERIESGLRQEFRHNPAVRELLPGIIQDVEAARLPPSAAARALLQARSGPPAPST